MEDLQVHHIQPRSRLGNDTAENLIALCVMCHQKAHRQRRKTEQEFLTPRSSKAVSFNKVSRQPKAKRACGIGLTPLPSSPARRDLLSSHEQVGDMSLSYPPDQ